VVVEWEGWGGEAEGGEDGGEGVEGGRVAEEGGGGAEGAHGRMVGVGWSRAAIEKPRVASAIHGGGPYKVERPRAECFT
jgi:hypothetical protein